MEAGLQLAVETEKSLTVNAALQVGADTAPQVNVEKGRTASQVIPASLKVHLTFANRKLLKIRISLKLCRLKTHLYS